MFIIEFDVIIRSNCFDRGVELVFSICNEGFKKVEGWVFGGK